MLPNQDTTNKTETLFAPAEQYVYSHIANPHTAPAERYVGAAHSTPLECKNVRITFSINIALRWSAAFSPGSRICETRRKIDVLLKDSTSTR